MLRWSIIFFVLALVAAVFGFGLISSTFAAAAKILFFAFVVIFVASLIMGGLRRV